MDDFSNGVFVGITQTFFGHPFDTLKVIKQTGKNIKLDKFILPHLYKGISFPLVGSSILNSVQFGTYQLLTEKYNFHSLTAGFLSGSISSFLINPLDIYKIKYQLQNEKKKINMWRGLHITFFRESISTSLYFSSYHYFNEDYNSFISGGFAGILSWLITYPIDVIKTRIQSNQNLSVISAYRIGNIWNGLGFCLFRSFIVNGSGFFVYDYLKDN